MVYFARKGNDVVHHTDIKAMREWDGVEPEQQLTEAEFLSNENMVRLIAGRIVFGKTPKERADEDIQKQIEEIDAELQWIDAHSGGRSVRAALISLKGKIPESAATDIQRVEEAEGKAAGLRSKRAKLVQGLGIPY